MKVCHSAQLVLPKVYNSPIYHPVHETISEWWKNSCRPMPSQCYSVRVKDHCDTQLSSSYQCIKINQISKILLLFAFQTRLIFPHWGKLTFKVSLSHFDIILRLKIPYKVKHLSDHSRSVLKSKNVLSNFDCVS